MRGPRFSRGREQGSVTLEALIIAPAIFVIVSLAATAGQIAYAKSVIQEAAQREARVASEARDFPAASNNVNTSYLAYYNNDKWYRLCVTNAPTTIDNGGIVFDSGQTPIPSFGAASLVSVTISCNLNMRLLPLRGLPSITIKVTAFSPLDPYRHHSLDPNSG